MDREINHIQTVNSNIEQSKLLLMIFQLLMKSGCCDDKRPHEWIKVLLAMHIKGYLYIGLEEGKLAAVVGAYMVETEDIKKASSVPEKEKGDILYVPFSASFAEDKLMLRKMFKEFIKAHPNVKKILISDDRTGKNKERVIEKLGAHNGKG